MGGLGGKEREGGALFPSLFFLHLAPHHFSPGTGRVQQREEKKTQTKHKNSPFFFSPFIQQPTKKNQITYCSHCWTFHNRALHKPRRGGCLKTGVRSGAPCKVVEFRHGRQQDTQELTLECFRSLVVEQPVCLDPFDGSAIRVLGTCLHHDDQSLEIIVVVQRVAYIKQAKGWGDIRRQGLCKLWQHVFEPAARWVNAQHFQSLECALLFIDFFVIRLRASGLHFFGTFIQIVLYSQLQPIQQLSSPQPTHPPTPPTHSNRAV